MEKMAFFATALEAADAALAMAGRNLAGVIAEAPPTEVHTIDRQCRLIESIRSTLSDLARKNRDEYSHFSVSSFTGCADLGQFPGPRR